MTFLGWILCLVIGPLVIYVAARLGYEVGYEMSTRDGERRRPAEPEEPIDVPAGFGISEDVPIVELSRWDLHSVGHVGVTKIDELTDKVLYESIGSHGERGAAPIDDFRRLARPFPPSGQSDGTDPVVIPFRKPPT